ncbi:MAG: sensor histidine kinase, partial [Agromyces sp.]
ALRGALAEAVRNAVRHASGPTVSRSVSIRVSVRVERERVIIRVADGGVGFDPDRVEAGRMGIRHSIRARMSAVGGGAEIHSRLGSGSTVELRWPGDSK